LKVWSLGVKVEKRLEEFLEDFFALQIVPGKRVRIPYWRNRFLAGGLRRIQGPFGGKGTPGQIRKITLKKAKEAGLDLSKMTSVQIRQFMKRKKIGLDCSGFAFQILEFLFPGFWRWLKMAPGKSHNPIRRFNAAALALPENTVEVRRIDDARIGDLIPLRFKRRGSVDHVMVVVDVAKGKIVYAHSSSITPVSGPHLGEIRVVNSKKRLGEQEWLEMTREGRSLGKFWVRELGVRRIRGFKTRK
jgi:hypothetical protein